MANEQFYLNADNSPTSAHGHYRAAIRLMNRLYGRKPAVSFGPLLEKCRRVKVTDEQLLVIRRMQGDGSKIAAIGRATGLSRPTIYEHLKPATGWVGADGVYPGRGYFVRG